MEKKSYVYILRCADGTLYTGYTTDLNRRFEEHQQGSRKCKYTMPKSRRPVEIACAWAVEAPRGNALRVEAFIKSLTRAQKMKLIRDGKTLARQYAEKKAHVITCALLDCYDFG